MMAILSSFSLSIKLHVFLDAPYFLEDIDAFSVLGI
jgi:hypothetical protein